MLGLRATGPPHGVDEQRLERVEVVYALIVAERDTNDAGRRMAGGPDRRVWLLELDARRCLGQHLDCRSARRHFVRLRVEVVELVLDGERRRHALHDRMIRLDRID